MYSAAAEGVVDESFPIGMALHVPPPDKARVIATPYGHHFDYDDGIHGLPLMLVARKVALRRSGGAQVSVILVNDLGSLDDITCALLAGLDVRDLVWLTAQSPGRPPSPPQPPPPTVGAFGCVCLLLMVNCAAHRQDHMHGYCYFYLRA
ncbi:hypothetical protein DFH09DRAFT_1366784 [Mycena vulgaris]|nr:hypothetical protein DFH09DRAFT_1366784 [Mycena vulgaris]